MATKRPSIALVEASNNRFVVDISIGRVIIEPDEVRFHRNGRGRGLVVVQSKPQ